jgi:hypothetical protein
MKFKIKKLDDNFVFQYIFFGLFFSFILGSFFINFFSILALILILIKFTKVNNFGLLKSNAVKLLILFFFFIIISSLTKSLEIKEFSLLRFLGLSLFAIYYKEHLKNNINKILIFLIILATFINLDIIYQYLYEKNILGWPKISGILSTGIFGKEKIAGSFISKILILSTPIYVLYSKNKKINLFFIINLILSIAVIIISTERKAIFDILFFFILLVIILPRWKSLFISLFFFTVFFILFQSIPNSSTYLIKKTTLQFGLEREIKDIKKLNSLCAQDNDKTCSSFFGIDKNSSISNNQYYAHYITAINIWRDFPLLGSGNKKFRDYCSEKKYEITNNQYSNMRCSTHPHNIYLTTLSEFGLIGFLLFLTIITQCFFNKENFDKNNITFIFVPFIIIFLLPVPNGNIYSSFLGSFFWFFLGFLIKKNK